MLIVDYSQKRAIVPEFSELGITRLPADFTSEIERNAFYQYNRNTWRKELKTNTTKRIIVQLTHFPEKDECVIKTNQHIGYISLTRDFHLVVEPRLGWETTFHILLTTFDTSAFVGHLSDLPIATQKGLDPEDLFFGFYAFLFLKEFKRLEKHGFYRELVSTGRNIYHIQGRLNIRKTVVNHLRGIPSHHCNVKTVNYANKYNQAICLAAITLKSELAKREVLQEAYLEKFNLHLLNELTISIDKLNSLGITYQKGTIDRSFVAMYSLPFHKKLCYRNILKLCYFILESIYFISSAEYERVYPVDFVLDMQTIFQDFTHAALTRCAAELNERYGVQLSIEQGASRQVFEGYEQYTANPDHLVLLDGKSLTILDSKYYLPMSELLSIHNRRQILSYLFLYDLNRGAFVTTFSRSEEIKILTNKYNDSYLNIISVPPESPHFVEKFLNEITDYLSKCIRATDVAIGH